MTGIEGLSPEQIQELVKLAGLGDKQDLLKEQIAQATALRNPRKSYGVWGGVTNGLADITDNVFRGLEARQAQQKLDANTAEIDRLRGLAGGALGRRPEVPRPEVGYRELLPDGKTRYTGGY